VKAEQHNVVVRESARSSIPETMMSESGNSGKPDTPLEPAHTLDEIMTPIRSDRDRTAAKAWRIFDFLQQPRTSTCLLRTR